MNILHVLSGDFVTGAETSAAALIRRQAAKGHRVLVAAGRFDHPVPAKVIPIPIHDRGWLARLRNVGKLRGVLRSKGIDLVHAHSRAASWVAHWACRWEGVPYLSTLHGRQHLHLSNKSFNVYGSRCAAVCEDIRDQMLEGTRVFEPGAITVIRNGIELGKRRR
jgi:hypothetical protein